MKATKKRLNAVLETYKKSLANVSATCKTNDISRTTWYEWIKDYEWFAKEVENIKEDTKDFVEGKLMQNISSGKEASIFFYLKTQAKDRGYIERTEVINKDVDEFDNLSDNELDEKLKEYEEQ